MQSKLFDSTVSGALNNVVDKLSKHDADEMHVSNEQYNDIAKARI